jgi:hypothetical protein
VVVVVGSVVIVVGSVVVVVGLVVVVEGSVVVVVGSARLLMMTYYLQVSLSSTVKPVLRGHIWDKEKVAS